MSDMDLLVIAAHADDAELSCGGTIARMAAQGRSCVLVDVTNAAAATRGTPEMRRAEAAEAARILGVVERVNLGLPDAHLLPTAEAIDAVVEVIRQYRPAVVLTHWSDDRHPDHFTVGDIVRHAWYKAGLAAYHPGATTAHRPGRLFHFYGPVLGDPRFCIDISPWWEIKLQAIRAYSSQFHHPESHKYGPETPIAGQAFLDFVETRARHFGSLIRTRHAEGFWCRETAEIHDLTALSRSPF